MNLALELDRHLGARHFDRAAELIDRLARDAALRETQPLAAALAPAGAAAGAFSTGGDVTGADDAARAAVELADRHWAAARATAGAGQDTAQDAAGHDTAHDTANHAESAVLALSAALRVLFHPERHTDVADTPLVSDPDGFLAPLRASRMLADLQGGNDPGASCAARVASRRPRVLVLPGAYPRFAGPLIQALGQPAPTAPEPARQPGSRLRRWLRRGPEAGVGSGVHDAEPARVDSLDLGERAGLFRWLGPNTAALAARVVEYGAAGSGASGLLPPRRGDREWFADLGPGDVLVADWADRGAAWASAVVPDGVRFVIRSHGADALNPWVHLIDWGRVDALIAVSAAHADLLRRVVGPRLDSVKTHVIAHPVPAHRFAAAQTPAADRTVGMLGWGRLVKDPDWALDVLEILLEHDRSWRLRLVGHPFPEAAATADAGLGSAGRTEYLRRWQQRSTGRLAEHLDLVPHTDEVPEALTGIGFIVSASLRESFHLAVAEGAAAGAIPVVRDWPIYLGGSHPARTTGEAATGPAATGEAATGPRGATAVYPADWVVSDPAEAAGRILRFSDSAARRRESDRVRSVAAERFGEVGFVSQVQRAAFG